MGVTTTNNPNDEEINPSTQQIATLKRLSEDVKQLQAKKQQETLTQTPIYDALKAEYIKDEEILEFFGKDGK